MKTQLQYFCKKCLNHFQNYRVDKLSSLVSQDSFWHLKLMEKLDNAFCHLSCCFCFQRICLWPFGEVVYHNANIYIPTIGSF